MSLSYGITFLCNCCRKLIIHWKVLYDIFLLKTCKVVYIKKKYGFKVHTAYIAEVKRSLGLTMYGAPNAVEELKHPRKRPPKEKIEAITDALRYFEVI